MIGLTRFLQSPERTLRERHERVSGYLPERANIGHVIAVVTDSSSCLPEDLAARMGIAVIPQQVRIGDDLEDERAASTPALFTAMRNGLHVQSSAPSAITFHRVYQHLQAAGATGILSVHISGRMSATVRAAETGAIGIGVPVQVVDSNVCGMSLGYLALAAGQAALMGGTLDQALNAVIKHSRATRQVTYVDSLDYLRRGGTIGATEAMLGDALSIRPLLTFFKGQVRTLQRVRGDKALDQVVKTMSRQAGRQLVDLAVEYGDNLDGAEELADRLKYQIPYVNQLIITRTSAVIGSHTGPGSLAVTVSPR
ncbi:DegV family protein [Pseudonocardiaceae bacterium YIM PH 21723]|nr:DegV family protein [Pseudonocardiaceae bacterium YIM PH 21723]